MDPDALYYDLIVAMRKREYEQAKPIARLLLELVAGGSTPLFYEPIVIRTYCNNVLDYY